MQLLPAQTITTAATFVGPVASNAAQGDVCAQATFTYGSGGTTCNVYVQTSIDSGVFWNDVAAFGFTTATLRKVQFLAYAVSVKVPVVLTDGALGNDTAIDGLLGNQWRVKIISTGTYAGGTTVRVDIIGQGFN
jgi:hypothetical protein